jgi:hypothetical protein
MVRSDQVDAPRTFIVLSNMLFIRMIGPVMERRHWVMRTEHAAQYASLLTPYRVRLMAVSRQGEQNDSKGSVNPTSVIPDGVAGNVSPGRNHLPR